MGTSLLHLLVPGSLTSFLPHPATIEAAASTPNSTTTNVPRIILSPRTDIENNERYGLDSMPSAPLRAAIDVPNSVLLIVLLVSVLPAVLLVLAATTSRRAKQHEPR